jgi:putative membrane protein
MKTSITLLAGALVLAGCASTTVPPPPMAQIDPSDPMFAPGYMAMAASGDQFEIQSSQLALQASSNPAVRSFANRLIADHSRMTQQMASVAQSAGLAPPPPMLLPQHQAMLDQLRGAGTGPAFDAAYAQVQVAAHQQALQLHQNYAQSGDVPALRTVASQAVPVVTAHLQHAQMLASAPPPPAAYPAPTPAPMPGERG